MPGPTITSFKEVGAKIKQYADAVLAMDVLNEVQTNQTISVQAGERLIQYQNTRKEPKLIDVINDIINANKEVIKPGDDFMVVVDGAAYVVRLEEPEHGEVQIKLLKKITQFPDSKIGLEDFESPIVSIKQEIGTFPVKFAVKIDGYELFNEKSLRPRELQRAVIARYGMKVIEGQPQQLAIMGTATGKSWVIAGVTHATGAGIIVVPDDILAREMIKDAIKPLHGDEVAKSVHTSKEYSTVEAFGTALLTTKQMILVADDPLFHEKAALIRDTVVLMDESHQHTFDEKSLSTLRYLKENNFLLALTGTPTSKLKDLLGQEMVDINVRSVMDSGGLRQNYRHTNTGVASTQLIERAVEGYFGQDEYFTRGPGVTSISDIEHSITEGRSEADAINQAILENRDRVLTQKDFFFSGDKKLRSKAKEAYDQIATGTFEDIDRLQLIIRGQRREAEIEARTDIIKALHPELDRDVIFRDQQQKVKPGPFVNLKEEILEAQKHEIAQSINAYALSLLYPEVAKGDQTFAKLQRIGQLEGFLATKGMTPQAPNDAAVQEMVKYLPADQRAEYIKQVLATAENIKQNPSHLCTAADIDLSVLRATYTTSVSMQTSEIDAQAKLDQLHTGLVMHVFSDARFSTGVSDTTVRCVTQIIGDKKDSLKGAVEGCQLHARNLRAEDLGATNIQVVAEGVGEDEYVSLETIFDLRSGALLDIYFNSEKRAQSNQDAFKQMKRQHSEVAKGEVPPGASADDPIGTVAQPDDSDPDALASGLSSKR